MKISQIPAPEVYKESSDFRFFIKLFEVALERIRYDTENMFDLYDPLRCPSNLLWMLADTMGFKFDERVPTAFNRLVLLYFMSLIRHKGSKDGITLAAQVNLAQFNIAEYGKENDELYDRLEDTSIPVNSAYVTSHIEEGYIDVVYFATESPTDVCIEYVRPLGMYCFQHPGVRLDSRTKISIDARLTDERDVGISIGPTHLGHYSREDYARLQNMCNQDSSKVNYMHRRNRVQTPADASTSTANTILNPGFRSLRSLQLSNNDHIVASLIKNPAYEDRQDSIFSIGYLPQDVATEIPDSYVKGRDEHFYNLQYDKTVEDSLGEVIRTIDDDRSSSIMSPRPAVNPPMACIGDAISLNTDNSVYTKVDDDGNILIVQY